jgi:hypothetical protein
MNGSKSRFFIFLAAIALCIGGHANLFKQLNPSIWTDYTRMNFENLSQEEKTHKLQLLFKDKVKFCQKHGIRRALVKILDPGSFTFFSPDNFNAEVDNNFLYWALQLSKFAEVEAVFDPGPFKLKPSTYSDKIVDYMKYFFKVKNYFNNFQGFIEKLEWVSLLNETANPTFNFAPTIKGITLTFEGIDEGEIQLVINALDQYKYNLVEELPENHFPSLRTAVVFNLDQQNLIYANLARFPLLTDIRSPIPNKIGLTLPMNFPAQGEEMLAPSWRPSNNAPLLDHVYLTFADERLVEPIYQNLGVIKDPTVANLQASQTLASYLVKTIMGIPFVKGPGTISIDKGTNEIKGKYTFFRTGNVKKHTGQFSSTSFFVLRPPYVAEETRKNIVEDPTTNKSMKISSAFSTTQNIVNAEYYMSPTPYRWGTVQASNYILSKIYYVFSTEFTPPHKRYMGNWHLDNFLGFFLKPPSSKQKNPTNTMSGFLEEPTFWTFSSPSFRKPSNNIVIYDFTTIPNGHPYPECNWNLGNKTHL